MTDQIKTKHSRQPAIRWTRYYLCEFLRLSLDMELVSYYSASLFIACCYNVSQKNRMGVRQTGSARAGNEALDWNKEVDKLLYWFVRKRELCVVPPRIDDFAVE